MIHCEHASPRPGSRSVAAAQLLLITSFVMSALSCPAMAQDGLTLDNPKSINHGLDDATVSAKLESLRQLPAFGPGAIEGDMMAVVRKLNLHLEQSRQSISPTEQLATASIEDLRNGFLELRRSFEAMDISIVKDETRPEGVPIQFPRLKLQMAFKGVRQRAEFIGFQSSTSSQPLHQRLEVFTGLEHLAYTTTSLEGSRSQKRSPETTAAARAYLKQIPLFVGPDAEGHQPIDDIASCFSILERAIFIEPMLSEVDGCPCHVVYSPYGVVMWIHYENDISYLRRYLLFGAFGDDEALTLSQIIAHRDFKEIGDGLLWPYETSESWFATDVTNKNPNPTWRGTYRFAVENIVCKDIDESQFSLEFPPGTKVIDTIRNVYYLVPDGTKNLEEALAAGAKILPDGNIPDFIKVDAPAAALTESGKPSSLRLWLLFLNLFMLAIIVLATFRKRKQSLSDR